MADDGDDLIDEHALSSLLLDFDRGEAREIVDVLRAQAHELAAEDATGGQDVLERIADAAHRLRSTCAVIGASAVSATCAEIERAGRRADADGVLAAIAILPGRAERTAARLLAGINAASDARG